MLLLHVLPAFCLFLFFIIALFTIFFCPSGSAQESALSNDSLYLKALAEGNLTQIKALVEAGVDINMENPDCAHGPLYYPAIQGNWEVFQFISEQGAKYSSLNELLYFAVRGNNTQIINYLLDKGATAHYSSFEEFSFVTAFSSFLFPLSPFLGFPVYTLKLNAMSQ